MEDLSPDILLRKKKHFESHDHETQPGPETRRFLNYHHDNDDMRPSAEKKKKNSIIHK